MPRTCIALDPWTRRPCGNPIPLGSRFDRETCSARCRKRLSRARPEAQHKAKIRSCRASLYNARAQLAHYRARVAELERELSDLEARG